MYPLDVFTMFPSYPRGNKVFVAMNFGGKYNDWYRNVIEPAIRDVSADGLNSVEKLEPFRVDCSKSGHPIKTEIFKNISTCFLFFADLTTLGTIERDKKEYACRSNNIMYEIGIATGVRLAEEVILFRSDNNDLPFDCNDLHVNRYSDPNNITKSIQNVKEALVSAINEVHIRKRYAVERAVDVLSESSRRLLMLTDIVAGTLPNPSMTFGRKLLEVSKTNTEENRIDLGMALHYVMQGIITDRSVNQLLDMGIISAQYSKETVDSSQKGDLGESFTITQDYTLTPFGKEVTKEVWRRIRE